MTIERESNTENGNIDPDSESNAFIVNGVSEDSCLEKAKTREQTPLPFRTMFMICVVTFVGKIDTCGGFKKTF